MRVHHLNCATMCPFGGRLVSGEGGVLATARLVCHCLLLETGGGLVLVDAGLGLADIASPRRRLGTGFLLGMRPALDPAESALRRVERLGFAASDVRHVVLTHLDLDHAGGLADFPDAKVHVLEAEHEAAHAPRSLTEKMRYHGDMWAHRVDWSLHRPGGEPWFGFECVRSLEGLPPEILLVPLHGHTRGHTGVAVDTGAGWILHAGDAYFYRGEMNESPTCPVALVSFQRFIREDAVAWSTNRARLRALAKERAGEVRVFSAHDPVELLQLEAASVRAAGVGVRAGERGALPG